MIGSIFPSYCDDEQWTKGRGPTAIQIGLATFGILALELAFIRWTSSQVRVFAYFNNLVLIGAFLGMGIGVALGRRYTGLVHWTLPVILLLSLLLAFSEEIGIMRMYLPEKTIILWGAGKYSVGFTEYLSNISIFIFIFCLIVVVFIFAGSAVGYLFPKIPTLRAYSSDLLGSLLGVIVFTITTFFNASPPVWFCVGCIPFLWLSRKPVSVLSFAGILLLASYSIKGAVYSPYNRIDIRTENNETFIEVNRDFHQDMLDLSREGLTNKGLSLERLKELIYSRIVYDLPFQINNAHDKALIIGAGTGNDVQAALRNGYKKVYSVDIDGGIIELGKRLHPEKPYSNPRVIPVVNDARAFFEQYEGPPFDVIFYGLVDSHAMFSSMSSLRLENYIYTEEGIRAAWKHISPKGHLGISFAIAEDWMVDRLYWTITKATGKRPVVIYHGMYRGVMFIVAPHMGNIFLDRLKKYPPIFPVTQQEQVDTTSDDWPFLYVKPGLFPTSYVLILIAVLIIAGISTPLAFGRKSLTSDFDHVLFLMGAAFMLIETRGVTSLSLLFGSTWIVNSFIFSGVLIMILVANLLVDRFKPLSPVPWFFLLFISVAGIWAFNNAYLNQFPMLVRGLVGGLITALPIGFAGVIVSILLARSANPSASLGSNLLGAVLGGCIEYSSMHIGLRALVLIALILYGLAFLTFLLKREKRGLKTWDGV